VSIGVYAMRTFAIAPIVLSLLTWTAFGNAFAEPAAASRAAWEAPTGHRQPNASNVPASVLRPEPQRSADDIELDKRLNICRGC
jgi:hypothetical protein